MPRNSSSGDYDVIKYSFIVRGRSRGGWGTMQIAIVGGGATGALAALHLTRALGPSTEIVVVEPAEEVGRGLAYTTDDPWHLLNVRVANMSAFPDQPDHLLAWLRNRRAVRNVADATPFCFIPRGIYGAYLADLVREIRARGGLRHVRDRCINVAEGVDRVLLTLELGETLATEFAVLATGHDAKRGHSSIPAVKPWSQTTLSKIEGDGSVLIIGTGLTMVDQVLSLERQRSRRKNQRTVSARPVTFCTPASKAIQVKQGRSIRRGTFRNRRLDAHYRERVHCRWRRLAFRNRCITAAYSALVALHVDCAEAPVSPARASLLGHLTSSHGAGS